MGSVLPFRRRKKPRRGRSGIGMRMVAAVLGAAALVGGLVGFSLVQAGVGDGQGGFACASPYVIDGDTLSCGGTRVRLQGIDAPELPGHCRAGRDCAPGDPFASTENLRRLTRGASLTCHPVDTDSYGRTIARCKAGTIDLSCAQISGGYAIRRYARIGC